MGFAQLSQLSHLLVPRQEYEARWTAQDEAISGLAAGVKELAAAISKLEAGIAGSFARLEEAQRGQKEDQVDLRRDLEALRTQVTNAALATQQQVATTQQQGLRMQLAALINGNKLAFGLINAVVGAVLYGILNGHILLR